jgi:hypothetical protein
MWDPGDRLDTLPAGCGLQDQGNGDSNRDRRIDRVRPPAVVMPQSAEMGILPAWRQTPPAAQGPADDDTRDHPHLHQG